jgi:E3 ubiquitin-protein ligase HUWE1
MPGHSYRTSAAYQRCNISLFTTESNSNVEDGSPLQATRSLRKQPSLSSMNSRTHSILTSKAQRLLHFVQNHKGLLNLVIKARPELLDSSFSAFARVKELRACLKFDNKRRYFFAQMKKSALNVSRRGVHLQIRRNQVFEDSFHQLRVRTAEELRGRLQVNFYGEEGVDAGGLSREWYVILAREIFNPNYALFTAAADGATFQPNPLSIINSNHLDYFKFVGRLIGKAICDGQLLDAHFTR